MLILSFVDPLNYEKKADMIQISVLCQVGRRELTAFGTVVYTALIELFNKCSNVL